MNLFFKPPSDFNIPLHITLPVGWLQTMTDFAPLVNLAARSTNIEPARGAGGRTRGRTRAGGTGGGERRISLDRTGPTPGALDWEPITGRTERGDRLKGMSGSHQERSSGGVFIGRLRRRRQGTIGDYTEWPACRSEPSTAPAVCAVPRLKTYC